MEMWDRLLVLNSYNSLEKKMVLSKFYGYSQQKGPTPLGACFAVEKLPDALKIQRQRADSGNSLRIDKQAGQRQKV